MRTPLNAGTALLLALLHGPSYGLDLIERVRVRSRGRIRLPQGAVYPALRDLERRKLLRRWTVSSAGTGRPRTYYELTPKGIAAAQGQRKAIAGIVASEAPTTYSRRELLPCESGSSSAARWPEAALWLRRAGEAAGL